MKLRDWIPPGLRKKWRKEQPAPEPQPEPTPEPVEACEPQPEPAPEPVPDVQPTPPERGTVLWYADHETGDLSQWTAGQGGEARFDNGGARTEITTERAYNGSYALKQTSPGNGIDEGARIFRWANLPERGLYSGHFLLPQRYHSMPWFNIMQWKSKGTQSNPVITLNIGNRPDGQMFLYAYDHIQQKGYTPHTSHVIAPNEWHRLEAEYRVSYQTNGSLRVSLNGVEIIAATNLQTLLGQGQQIQWSVNSYCNVIQPKPAVVYWDDCEIRTL